MEKEAIGKRPSELDKVKDAAVQLAATKNGKILLAYLCKMCGTFASGMNQTQTAGFDRAALEYNEGRRSVYVGTIRPLIRNSDSLNEIEREAIV